MKGFWKVQWWFSWVLKDVSVVLRQVACEEKAGTRGGTCIWLWIYCVPLLVRTR